MTTPRARFHRNGFSGQSVGREEVGGALIVVTICSNRKPFRFTVTMATLTSQTELLVERLPQKTMSSFPG